MSIEYYGDREIDQVFADLLARHPDLRLLYEADVVFRICAVRKINKDEEPVPLRGPVIRVKRISKEDRPFIEGHYKVYVDACRWEQANEEQREALVHYALCSVGVEQTKSGIKLVKVQPDVLVYQRNVSWYGPYEEPLVTLRNNLQSGKKGLVLSGAPVQPVEQEDSDKKPAKKSRRKTSE